MRTSLLGLLLLLPSIGCISLKKSGPLWGKEDPSSAGPIRTKNGIVMPPKDAGAMALEEGGPRPPAPSFLVTPNEVNEVNAHEIAARAREEMQRDMNAQFPAYPLVSKIQR